MKPKYNSLEEIQRDLKRYKLEQQIALEELKSVKGELKEQLNPTRIVKNTFEKYSSWYTILSYIKKIF
jgi:hypothetical protein